MKLKDMININKIEDLDNLINIINQTDEGCGDYTAKEVNEFLYESGLSDKEGGFLPHPHPSKEKVIDYLVDMLWAE